MKTRQYDFNFCDGEVRAFERKDADGKTHLYIGGTASSTYKDLYGDVIAPQGQQKMFDKLQGLAGKLRLVDGGLTAFLNHSYKIPEDTLGVFTSAALNRRTGDDGVEYLDLDIECRVHQNNPRALAAYEQIKDGIRHGWSIGAYFLEYDWLSPDPDDWGVLVTDVDLLEISLVGIPANQRAWSTQKTATSELAESLKSKALAAKERGIGRELVLKSLVADAGEPSEVEVQAAYARVNTHQPHVQLNQLDSATGFDSPSNAGLGTVTESVAASASPTFRGMVLGSDTATSSVSTLPFAYSIPSTESATSITIGVAGAVPDVQPQVTASAMMPAEDAALVVEALKATETAVQETAKPAPTETTETLAAETAEPAGPKGELAKQLLDCSVELGESIKTDTFEARMLQARTLLLAASYALAKRDPADGDTEPTDTSPDDQRDRIGMAMSYVAKAVGHGLCIRGAGHIAKALDCLSGAVTNPDDNMDDTPAALKTVASMAVAVQKLEPKAGDVIVIRSGGYKPVTGDGVAAAYHELEALKSALPEGVGIMLMGADAEATIDSTLAAKSEALTAIDTNLTERQAELGTLTTLIANAKTEIEKLKAEIASLEPQVAAHKTILDFKDGELAALIGKKQEELASLEATLATKTAELVTVESKTAAGKNELAALEAKIKAAGDTPLPRKSRTLQEALLESRTASMSPEHYDRSPIERREALAAMLSGKSNLEARDVAAL